MTPSITLTNTDPKELVRQTNMFRRAVENIGKAVEDDADDTVPGALLSWNSGPFRKAHVVVHPQPYLSIVQVIETRIVGDIQLEMAWQTQDIWSDAAAIREIACRMVAHATRIAADAHRDWSHPDWPHHRQARSDLREKALQANAAAGAYVAGMISAHSATPWSTAWIRLQGKRYDLDASGQMVDVEVVKNRDCSTLSMMAHVLSVEVPSEGGTSRGCSL